jgi:hypothetical protein
MINMKKSNSTSTLIVAIAWFMVSIMWFFEARYEMGIFWLCGAGIFLFIAITQRKKEKDDK